MQKLNVEELCKMLSEVTTFSKIEISKLSINDVKFLCKKFLDKNLTIILEHEVDNSYTINEVLDKYFYEKDSDMCRKATKTYPIPTPPSVGEKSDTILQWDIDFNTSDLEKYQADTSIVNELTQELAQELANNTDEIIRTSINKYLGNDTWTIEEIVGRGVMQCVNDADYLFMDGILILELYPYESQYDICQPENTSYMTNMTRKYRMHV